MILGSTPATAAETILANGSNVFVRTASSEAIRSAAAPSFNPDEFPAVTLPSFLNTVLKPLSDSIVEFARGNSS